MFLTLSFFENCMFRNYVVYLLVVRQRTQWGDVYIAEYLIVT